MIALEKFSRSWWSVVVMMVAIVIVELWIGTYIDYTPDALTDIPADSSH
jgi:hypothetical protein